MYLLHLLAALHLFWTTSYAQAIPSPGTIVLPKNGTAIAPGALFDFQYQTRADYGTSSYNFTVWLFTSPLMLVPAELITTGYYFGRFSEPNYPGNPHSDNPPPSQLRMPNFAQNPGGFGAGKSAANVVSYLTVFEEYATGEPALGYRFSMASNYVIYNSTKP